MSYIYYHRVYSTYSKNFYETTSEFLIPALHQLLCLENLIIFHCALNCEEICGEGGRRWKEDGLTFRFLVHNGVKGGGGERGAAFKRTTPRPPLLPTQTSYLLLPLKQNCHAACGPIKALSGALGVSPLMRSLFQNH